MKRNTIAVLTAALLLLMAASGCGSKELTNESMAETQVVTNADGETVVVSETPAADVPTETQIVTDENGETSVVEITPTTAVETAPNDEVGEGQTAPPEGADNDQEGDYGTAAPTTAAADKPADTGSSANGSNAKGKLHITVETAEVTLDQLKAQDYTVPLVITLDKNPGINYSEWGLKLDERCTYTTSTRGMDFSTVAYINDAKHFMWTAWTSGAELTTTEGSLLTLNVKLPLDAKPGTTYTIAYADWSMADAPHNWQGEQDWASENEVGWTNGGVVVK